MADSEHQQKPHWRDHLGWPLLLGLGWLIYELTAQPAIGAVVACAKFGWDDVLTGLWLRRRDPNRSRGRVCFWWYWASALWKVTLVAGIVMWTIAVVQAARNAKQPWDRKTQAVAIATFMEAFCGWFLASLITVRAIGSAQHRKIRVWIDSAVHRARRERVWPPPYWSKNRASWLLVLMLVCPAVLIVVIGTAIGVVLIRRPGTIAPLAVPLSLVMLMAIRKVRKAAARRVIADGPWDCWPELLHMAVLDDSELSQRIGNAMNGKNDLGPLVIKANGSSVA